MVSMGGSSPHPTVSQHQHQHQQMMMHPGSQQLQVVFGAPQTMQYVAMQTAASQQ